MKNLLHPWAGQTPLTVHGDEPSKGEVLAHLEAILASTQFRSSRRSQQLLRYVVQNTLDGRKELLKERIIGIDVFARAENYEPSEDSIVRVNASDVRKRLSQYYLDHAQSGMRIEVPAGSYVPEFRIVEDASSKPLVQPSVRPVWHRYVLATVLALICVGTWILFPATSNAFERFWSPVEHNPGHPLICTSAVSAIELPLRLKNDLSNEVFGNVHEFHLMPSEIGFTPEMQITRGNFMAVLAFNGVAERLGRSAEIRLRPEISLEERRTRPIILIGAFSNPLGMDLNRELRFHFERWHEGGKNGMELIDRKRVSPVWRVELGPRSNYNLKLDYALVTRVFDSSTHQTLVWAAGVSQFGTQAAAEFATNPVYWTDLAKTAPPGWDRKNLQIVLSTEIHNSIPKPPKMLETHVW